MRHGTPPAREPINPFLFWIQIVITIDGRVGDSFRSAIQPANLNAVDVGLRSDTEMNRVGVLGPMRISVHKVPHCAVASVMNPHANAHG